MKPSEVRAATQRLPPPSQDLLQELSPAAQAQLWATWNRVVLLRDFIIEELATEPAALESLVHLGRVWGMLTDAIVERDERDR